MLLFYRFANDRATLSVAGVIAPSTHLEVVFTTATCVRARRETERVFPRLVRGLKRSEPDTYECVGTAMEVQATVSLIAIPQTHRFPYVIVVAAFFG